MTGLRAIATPRRAAAWPGRGLPAGTPDAHSRHPTGRSVSRPMPGPPAALTDPGRQELGLADPGRAVGGKPRPAAPNRMAGPTCSSLPRSPPRLPGSSAPCVPQRDGRTTRTVGAWEILRRASCDCDLSFASVDVCNVRSTVCRFDPRCLKSAMLSNCFRMIWRYQEPALPESANVNLH